MVRGSGTYHTHLTALSDKMSKKSQFYQSIKYFYISFQVVIKQMAAVTDVDIVLTISPELNGRNIKTSFSLLYGKKPLIVMNLKRNFG